MMYLVLTAMLALNVSREVLDSFALVDEGLFKTTSNFAAKNKTIYAEFERQKANSAEKVGPWQDKALTVREKADRLVEDLQQLKIEIVAAADGKDAKALKDTTRALWSQKAQAFVNEPSADIDDKLISAKDNNNNPAEIMIFNGKGAELKEKMVAFRELALSLVSEKNPEIKNSIEESLNTANTPEDKERGEPEISWEASYFEHLPLIAVLTNLTKFQSDVRNVEAEITQHLLAQIDAGSLKVNKIEAIVIAPSNYVLQGDTYEASVILAAYDSLQKPEVTVNGQLLSYDASGKATYRASGSTPGNYKWGGILSLINPDGAVVKYPFNAEYQVGKADAVISATKMNVFYIGVDNPVSISVSGVPSDKISATMTNGTLSKSGNGWIAKPLKAGTMATVTVSANGKVMGKMDYRVKTVPNPVAKVAGKISGKIDKATLVAQVAVQAEMENFDFDLKFRVTEFSVSAIVKGFAQDKFTKGAAITPEQKSLINGLAKGAKVYFEGIKVVGPDGSSRELPAIAFTIN
ncbi:MAG: gliding motility protein GldM [Bacteroidales bacterium]|nr:gliding motility protein GldM [Bacteroidales bacterium]